MSVGLPKIETVHFLDKINNIFKFCEINLIVLKFLNNYSF